MTDHSTDALIQGISNLLHAGNAAAARKLVEHLLAIAPDEPCTLDAAVCVSLAVGEIETAWSHCSRLISLRPDEYRGHELAASVAFAAGSFYPSLWSKLPWKSEAARLSFIDAAIHESLRLFPENAVSLAYLGNLQLDRKDYVAALCVAETGLKIDPAYVPLLVVRGRAEYAQEYWHDARSTLLRALQIEPENTQVHTWLARISTTLNDHHQAFEHAQAAIAKSPGNSELRALYWETARHQSFALRCLLHIERLTKQLRLAIIPGAILIMLCFISGNTLLVAIGLVTVLLLLPLVFADALIRPLIHAVHLASSPRYRRARGKLFWIMCLSGACGLGLLIAVNADWPAHVVLPLAGVNWFLLIYALLRIGDLRSTWPLFAVFAAISAVVGVGLRASERYGVDTWLDVLSTCTLMTCTIGPLLIWQRELEI